MDNIPLDIINKITATAAKLCIHKHERASLQKTLIHVNRLFCCSVINSPIVCLDDALELRDPLAANIAVKHLAMHANPESKLLDTPQVVGVAMSLRSRKPRVPDGEFDVYLIRLASIIKSRVFRTFRDSDLMYASSPLHVMMLRYWNDDWKKVAHIMTRRKIKPHLIGRAIKVAASEGHTNCLKLLTEFMPDEARHCGHTLRSDLRRAQCYAYLANRRGLYLLRKEQVYLYFCTTIDSSGKTSAMFGHITEQEYWNNMLSPDERVVRCNFEKVPPFDVDVPEPFEDFFLYNAEKTDFFRPGPGVVDKVFLCMEETGAINNKSEYEAFVRRISRMLLTI